MQVAWGRFGMEQPRPGQVTASAAAMQPRMHQIITELLPHGPLPALCWAFM